MTSKSWISRLGALLIALALAVAPSVSGCTPSEMLTR
jgi:hypothetical protein